MRKTIGGVFNSKHQKQPRTYDQTARFLVQRRCFRGSGFSLVEIMVVLVIIGLLAGVVTINVRGYLVKGKQNTARLEIARIVDALETFYSLHDRYPSNEESLRVLYEGTERMTEGLLDGEAIDPWGRPYQYNAPGRNGPYEVVSFGSDGQEGGEGNEADVESWNLKEVNGDGS